MTREAREWTLIHFDAVPLLNAERSGHWREHRETTRAWRQAFKILALAQKIPLLDAIEVVVTHERKTKRSVDCAAAAPAAKAAVDGIVDAGVLVNDTPVFVRRITFEAPVVTGQEGLRVLIRELLV